MLELKMEECVNGGDAPALVSVLHCEGLTVATLTRLDHLVTKELCASGFSRVTIILKSLGILSENKDDLQQLLSHGLVTKVLMWFETLHDLMTSDLQRNSTLMLSLAEEFYDYFLLLAQTPLTVSQLSVVLLQLARSALESEISFTLRLEAIRTFNSILETLSRDQRRTIQLDANLTVTLSQMAAAVPTVGDYELQVSLSEGLCRLTPRKDRELRATRWFLSHDISTAFCNIRDGDFEVDCRHFLNFVNSYHGDQRRVYTFPCLSAFLDSTELFCPKDEKLDEFWIDFNLGSGCVSFFIDEPQGFLWGSIHLLKEEVDHYSFQHKHEECSEAETILSVVLNNPIMHHNTRGQTVALTFSAKHHRQLEDAAARVFMKLKSAPCVKEAVGTANTSPSAVKANHRFHKRKNTRAKSQLKILPLSSPSSEEDVSLNVTQRTSRAEFLFDQIRHSTPMQSHGWDSGVTAGAEHDITQEQISPFELNSFHLEKEVVGGNRKRAASESGYISDPTEGTSAQRKKINLQPEGVEFESGMTEPEENEPLVKGDVSSTEWVESKLEEKEPLNDGGDLGVEPKAELTSDITAAFKTFRTQLEQHFTDCWQKFEAEILLSINQCQQHVVSLLTAVHQQRLFMLQRFENGITEHLNQLQENSSSLNTINTQILRYFQSEVQSLTSFCDEHHQRLKSLEKTEVERSSHPVDEGVQSGREHVK